MGLMVFRRREEMLQEGSIGSWLFFFCPSPHDHCQQPFHLLQDQMWLKWYQKKSWIRYRKIWYRKSIRFGIEKSLGFGFITHWAKMCSFGDPGSAIEVFFGARAHDMDITHPVGPTCDSWDRIRPLGTFRRPPWPPKGPFWASVGT